MTTSLNTIEQLKLLTLELSNSPLGDYRKVATMFEAIGDVVSILTNKNKEQQKLLNDKNILEQQNKINESRYKTIFEQSPDAIFIMYETTCIDCNKKALELFCCKKEDIINTNPIKFSPKLQPNGLLSENEIERYTKAVIEGYRQSFKWRYLNKYGIPFDVWINLNRIEMNGGCWFIANLHKIINRK